MMRASVLLLFLTLAAGCGSTTGLTSENAGRSASETVITSEDPLYLDSAEVQAAELREFLKNRTAFNEIDKINYLLSAVSRSRSDFIRNGQHFGGSKASGWLRWKMHHPQFKNNPIITARDFVDRVAIRSEKTGFPYELISPDGDRRTLHDVLSSELNALEEAILQYAPANNTQKNKGL